jgi:ribonuclease HII
MKPSLEREHVLWQQGFTRIVGVDEVGRGCLSGPVIVAAVVLQPHCTMLAGVMDSKKLTPRQREHCYPHILAQAQAVSLGAASVKEIDRLNILYATLLAMERALARLRPYDHALIDGRFPPRAALQPYSTVIQGDSQCYAIACASIIAKVRRDRLMRTLAQRYPGYGWEKNAGYGTRTHLHALNTLGVTHLHRRSFAPVRAALTSGINSVFGSPK